MPNKQERKSGKAILHVRSIVIAVLCSIVVVGIAFAQSGLGTITGTIADSAGAMIPAAICEAKHTETGALYQAASTSTGNYTLTSLPPGMYQLSASVPGFKQYVRTGITVLAAQTLRIDIALEVGNITDTVTVNADAPLLKTESGELSHNVSSDKLSSLPVLGFQAVIRDPLATAILIPGAAYRSRNYVRVNGSPINSQSVRLEGQDANNGTLIANTTMVQQSVDAIEEVAIQTSNYAAEYGQAGGGLFNITMRAGTNAFHGSAYDYFSNEFLNANVPFLNNKDKVRRHDYGFTLGGPVLIPKVYNGHDKTFFFFSFEQYRETSRYTTLKYTVPTLAYREGDFRQALTGKVLGKDPLGRDIIEGTIYDPQTDRIAPNGQRVRDPFPNNTIPKDRFDSVAAKIQALIPVPQGPTKNDITANYLNPWESPNIRTVPSIKIDHNLSAKSKLSFLWTRIGTWNPFTSTYSEGFPSPVTVTRNTDQVANTTRLAFDHSLTPTALLHLGVGTMTLRFSDASPYSNFDQFKELGLSGAGATFFPYITGLGGGTPAAARGGMKDMGPYMQSRTSYLKTTASASLMWVKSNHTYKFGAEMRLEGYPAAIINPAYGFYTFSGDQTGLAISGLNLSGGTIGFPYASFLLGLVNNGDIGVVANPKLGKSAWDLFAQDTWKITHRLTLDYGLRWDYQGYLRESHGRASNFSPTTANPSTGNLMGAVIFEGSGTGHCNCDFARVYPYAFGPRLGVAYQINPKTVLRAGAGIFYMQTASENQTSSNFASSNPFTSPSFGDPAMVLRNGPPAPRPWPNLDPGQYPFKGIPSPVPVAIDHNGGRPARQIQWSIGIQREIFRNLSIEASYVGNRGAWWEANQLIDVNALTPERMASFGLNINNAADQALLTSALNSATAKNRGFSTPPYATFPLTNTVAQSLRPFPQFTTITYRWAPLGRTWYDSLQLKVTKRFSYGIDASSAFTWQKELTMGGESATTTSLAAVNNIFDRKTNKYISRYSRPFVWITSLNYTLPKVKTNKALSLVIRDWTIGAVLEYASAFPIQAPTAQNKLSSYLFRNTFANRVPGQPLFAKRVTVNGQITYVPIDLNDKSSYDAYSDFVLNPNAWVDPLTGQYGVSAAYHNDYRYQRHPLEAMSIGRIFRLKEGVSLSIRADFQNIFNRLVYGDPTATNAKASQLYEATGETKSGFGDINTNSMPTNLSPRRGIIVARVQF
jgi:hypothetical protein